MEISAAQDHGIPEGMVPLVTWTYQVWGLKTWETAPEAMDPLLIAALGKTVYRAQAEPPPLPIVDAADVLGAPVCIVEEWQVGEQTWRSVWRKP